LSSPIEAKPDSGTPDSLFTFVLVKPTHYDDDGYPIQWFRSALPSNTLACMNSLAEDASKREVLGPGVRIEVDTTMRPIAACSRAGLSATSSAGAGGR
jgi:hypothetical protein